MKKTLFIFAWIIATTLGSTQVKANYATGGELIFVHLADSTYQFFFKLQVDCSGGTEPDTIPLCFYNPCDSVDFSVPMPKWTGTGGSTIIKPLCSVGATNCDSPGSLILAHKEVFYAAVVTMPSRCNAWKVFTRTVMRDTLDNFQNAASTPMYIEALMNNSTTDSNSSPFYTARQPYGVPFNQYYAFNAGAVDADGDSLWHDLILPITGSTNCNDTTFNINFGSASPAYNMITNPFQTNNTFVFNRFTGQMQFTPGKLGRSGIVMRTKEYRNGVLIGSVMREMQIRTMQLPQAPTYTSDITCPQPPTNANGMVYGCVNNNLSYCFSYKSSDTNSRIFISDNLATSIPGASITYSNQGTDSIHIMFSWTPGLNDAGASSYYLFIVDSLCSFPVPLQYLRTIDHMIWGPVEASRDTTICSGQPAFLSVTGGGQHQWTVLNGSQNSLSNPNAPNPVATPTVTTTYLVTSTINPYCTNIGKDTVTIFVRPSTPGASAMSTSFGCGHNPLVNYINACPGQNISFCFNTGSTDADALLYPSDNSNADIPAATVNYSGQGTNSISGTFSWTPGQNDIGFHQLVLSTYDSACIAGGGSHLKQQVVGILVWGAPKITGNDFICPGESVQLAASGGLGYRWRVISGTDSMSDYDIYNPVAVPSVTTTYVVTSLANAYCSNNTDTHTVRVYPAQQISRPSVSITASPAINFHWGDSVTFTANATGCKNITFRWLVNGTQVPGAYKSTYSTNKLLNLDEVKCLVICGDTCATPVETTSNGIMVTVRTGVNDISGDGTPHLYPNPNNGTFYIEMDAANELPLVRVVNLYGQEVHRSRAQSGITTINLQQQPQGVYFLKVGERVTRFVISK